MMELEEADSITEENIDSDLTESEEYRRKSK